MENETKGALKSLGVVGPIISMIAVGLGYIGYEVGPDVIAEATSAVQQGVLLVAGVISLFGSVLGIIGRIRASKKIKGLVS